MSDTGDMLLTDSDPNYVRNACILIASIGAGFVLTLVMLAIVW